MIVRVKCPHCRALTSVLPGLTGPGEERRQVDHCDACDGELVITVRAVYRLAAERGAAPEPESGEG